MVSSTVSCCSLQTQLLLLANCLCVSLAVLLTPQLSLSCTLTCTCCYDLTEGTQDKDFSYSFSDSLSCTLYLPGAQRMRWPLMVDGGARFVPKTRNRGHQHYKLPLDTTLKRHWQQRTMVCASRYSQLHNTQLLDNGLCLSLYLELLLWPHRKDVGQI